VPELHVHPSAGGDWVVDLADARAAVSSHRTASEAERAARRHAPSCGARNIYLHDAYHRVRNVSATVSHGAAARAARIVSSSS
jgi:hypothetical protein